MKLRDYEGLATAVILYAAREYVESRRWIETHGAPGSAYETVGDLYDEKTKALRSGDVKRAREIQRQIDRFKQQCNVEIDIADLRIFFTSQYFHFLAPTIDGTEFLQMLDDRIAKDKKFKVTFDEDI